MAEEGTVARVKRSMTALLKGTGGIVGGAADVAKDATVTTLKDAGEVATTVTGTASRHRRRCAVGC